MYIQIIRSRYLILIPLIILLGSVIFTSISYGLNSDVTKTSYCGSSGCYRILTPNATTVVKTGDVLPITWEQPLGAQPQFTRLEYEAGPTATRYEITSNATMDGSKIVQTYNWTVPAHPISQKDDLSVITGKNFRVHFYIAGLELISEPFTISDALEADKNPDEKGCADSDGGIRPFVAGTTCIHGLNCSTDKCISGTPNKYYEYYCYEGRVLLDTLTCPVNTYCQEGACVDKPTNAQDGPDLTLQYVSRDTEKMTFQVCNKGNVLVNTPFIKASINGQSRSDMFTIININDCKSYNLFYSYFPITLPWTGVVEVMVDPDNNVAERDESNNRYVQTVALGSSNGESLLADGQETASIEREKNAQKKVNYKLTQRLRGRLLLLTEQGGEVWYLDPIRLKKYYLPNGQRAAEALRIFGLGVHHADLVKIPDGDTNQSDNSITGNDLKFVNRLLGRILIDVDNSGKAYYVNPIDKKRYYISPDTAYDIMKKLSLGIRSSDFSQVGTVSSF